MFSIVMLVYQRVSGPTKRHHRTHGGDSKQIPGGAKTKILAKKLKLGIRSRF